jgi:hypothetical protein
MVLQNPETSKELTPQEICQFFSGCFVKTGGSLRVLKYLELASI